MMVDLDQLHFAHCNIHSLEVPSTFLEMEHVSSHMAASFETILDSHRSVEDRCELPAISVHLKESRRNQKSIRALPGLIGISCGFEKVPVPSYRDLDVDPSMTV